MYLRISFKSQMLGRGVGVHAFLPFHDGYEDAQAPYPTLYFLPGYSANAEELATLLPLRRFSTEYGVAVIIPDGENSFYTDHPERCALFSSYVGDELVRVTRRMLPCLSTRREDTWIGGISMGGYGAWKLGLGASETFGAAASLSGALDIVQDYIRNSEENQNKNPLFRGIFGTEEELKGSDNDILALAEKLASRKKELPRLYAWCGTEDFLYEGNLKAWDHVKKLGYDLTCCETAGDHQWKYWDEKIQDVLRWWLGTDMDLQ